MFPAFQFHDSSIENSSFPWQWMQIPSLAGLTLEQVAKGSRWEVKTLSTRDRAPNLLRATVEISSATWILSLLIKSKEYPTILLPGTPGTEDIVGIQRWAVLWVTVQEFVPWIAGAVQREVDFAESCRNVGLWQKNCSGKNTGQANLGTGWEDSALL